jgi:hypothetical protein
MNICELYSENTLRKAVVCKSEQGYYVDCFEDDGSFDRMIDTSGHSEQYAFDTAENWVNKWGNFK